MINLSRLQLQTFQKFFVVEVCAAGKINLADSIARTLINFESYIHFAVSKLCVCIYIEIEEAPFVVNSLQSCDILCRYFFNIVSGPKKPFRCFCLYSVFER